MSLKDHIKFIAKKSREIEDEQLKLNMKKAESVATVHYNKVKLSLMDSAKEDRYESDGDQRILIAEHEWHSSEIEYGLLLEYLPLDTEKKFISDERGIKYEIKDKKIFDVYFSTVTKLAEEDEVRISLCGKYSENGETKYFPVPGSLEHINKHNDTVWMFKEIKIVLRGEMYL